MDTIKSINLFLYMSQIKFEKNKLTNMKTNYKVFKFFVILMITAFQMAGQGLSGVYTIDQTQAASPTNFISFNALSTALTASGVAGPVTVNVVANTGPYNEQVLFTSIANSSNINRININGNGNLITFNSVNAAQSWVIGMNSADFFSFSNLNVSGTGTQANAAYLYAGADFNIFSNCTFSVPLNTTGSTQNPVVIAGNATSIFSTGNSGNGNLFTGCQMFGGYTGVWMYGNTSAPFSSDNSIVNCTITEWYIYGVYGYYSRNLTVRGCIVERPTRTLITTAYGLFFIINQGLMCEQNQVRNLAGGMTTGVTTLFGIYGYNNSATNGANPNIVRDNMVYDFRNNGAIYGIYYYNMDGSMYNNTISFDHTGSTATSITYGIYAYGASGQPTDMRNNLVTISRGGTGTKYCAYIAVANAFITIDRENYFISSTAGTNFYAFYNGNQANLAALQTQGFNLNGYSIDPIYTNLATNNLYPTNTLLNNLATPVAGNIFDCLGAIRNTTTPDIGALEFLTPTCTGTPSNTVLSPSFAICPGGSVNVSIGTLNPDAGFTYQWRTSAISQVGPFNNIAGANGISYVAPSVTNNTWFSVVVTCTAPGGTSVSAVSQVLVAGTTTNTVPYNEGFEGIGLDNRLPNCSWFSPQIFGATKTYTSTRTGNRIARNGSSYATFDLGGGTGTSHYYSNGILLQPGITYSTSVWYQTDFTGATNWTDLSILTGPNQSTLGLTSIVSSNGPALSPIYKSLSGTFTVATAGIYYMAIRATAANGAATFLTFDDFSVIIPCTATLNPANITFTLNVPNNNICSGTPVQITAIGANTYSWNTGNFTPSITVSPLNTFTYVAQGTNLTTGCVGLGTQVINVRQSPSLIAFAIPPIVCVGKSANVSAQGATNYNWNNGLNGSLISVSPNTTTSYTVIGSLANGCSNSVAVTVSINTLPLINTGISKTTACKDEEFGLSATGASSYLWTSNLSSNLLQGSNVTTALPTTGNAIYTVTGTDANGCVNTATISLTINACTGLNNLSKSELNVSLYPNPTNGVLSIEFQQAGNNSISISDVLGREVLNYNNVNSQTQVNMSELVNGVYYVKLTSDKKSMIKKVIKE
jgi:hypothetical protein